MSIRSWLSWRAPWAREQVKDISRQAVTLTSEFSLLVNSYPVEFVDAALLPAPKEGLEFAFRYVWAMSEPDMRAMAEVIYVQLFRFQDGVGVVPVSPEKRGTSDTDEVSPEWLAWVQKTKTEANKLIADIEEWRTNPPPS